MRDIIPYRKDLKKLARELRLNPTKSEKILWSHIKAKNIHGFDFHRQKPLLDYIVDFYCLELKLCVELDGYTHQIDTVRQKDLTKQKALENEGLTVLRFTDHQVFNDLNNVLRTIEQQALNKLSMEDLGDRKMTHSLPRSSEGTQMKHV